MTRGYVFHVRERFLTSRDWYTLRLLAHFVPCQSLFCGSFLNDSSRRYSSHSRLVALCSTCDVRINFMSGDRCTLGQLLLLGPVMNLWLVLEWLQSWIVSTFYDYFDCPQTNSRPSRGASSLSWPFPVCLHFLNHYNVRPVALCGFVGHPVLWVMKCFRKFSGWRASFILVQLALLKAEYIRPRVTWEIPRSSWYLLPVRNP